MSIIRCEYCEREVDTDFEEVEDVNGKVYCTHPKCLELFSEHMVELIKMSKFEEYCNQGHCPDKELHRNYCLEAFLAGRESVLKKKEQDNE